LDDDPDNDVCVKVSPNKTVSAFIIISVFTVVGSKLLQIILLVVVESVRTNEAVAEELVKKLKALVELLYCIRPL